MNRISLIIHHIGKNIYYHQNEKSDTSENPRSGELLPIHPPPSTTAPAFNDTPADSDWKSNHLTLLPGIEPKPQRVWDGHGLGKRS